jgi:hypothetical protein
MFVRRSALRKPSGSCGLAVTLGDATTFPKQINFIPDIDSINALLANGIHTFDAFD